jgi:hypothetical protein
VVVVLVGGGFFFCLPGQGVVVVALILFVPSVVVNDWEFYFHSTSFSSTKISNN